VKRVTSERDIVERLRHLASFQASKNDSDVINAGADEIERLRKAVRHDSGSLEDQPASPEHDDAGDDTPSIDPELFAELKAFAEALPPNRIGDQDVGAHRMTSESDIVLELRTMARLIETKKASITFNEQDAAHLRQAADELEDMHVTLDKTTIGCPCRA
jgi:hypothetical protein